MINAVVGILKKTNQVLIAERPVGKPYNGYWEFPGGKVEPGETGQDALKRELYEELGIEVCSLHHWLRHTHQYPDKLVALEIFLVTEFFGEPRGKENQNLRWVTFPELLILPLLEGNVALLDKLKLLMT